MQHRSTIILMAAVGYVFLALPAAGGVMWGRPEATRGMRLGVTAGQMQRFEGEVRETQRAWDEPEEVWETYAFRLENYTLEELGLDEAFPLFGLLFERQGRFFAWDLRGVYMNPSASAVARRDYYIAVNRVSHEGRRYDHMMIPEGERFTSELQGGTLHARLFFTPFSLGSDESFSLTPWLRVGIFGMGGRYEVDAGPSRGITVYESAEYEYVIGGRGRGSAGLGVPEYAFGGEWSIALRHTESGAWRLTLRGEAAFFDYDGDTTLFGLRSARNQKNIDLTWRTLEGEVRLDVPLRSGRTLFFGAGYRRMEADASLEAIERSYEAQQILMEKYDKDFDVKGELWQVSAGLAF